MLQYIIDTDRPSLEEDVKNAIDHGCKWIEYNPQGLQKSKIEANINVIKPLCKENDCILILANDIEMAKRLEMDGVHLTDSQIKASTARIELGEGAIIGITVTDYEDIKSLKGMDIDYVQLGFFNPDGSTTDKSTRQLTLDDYSTIHQQCSTNDIETPIVAIGGIKVDDIIPLLRTGIQAVAIMQSSIDGKDSDSKLAEALKIVQNIAAERQE